MCYDILLKDSHLFPVAQREHKNQKSERRKISLASTTTSSSLYLLSDLAVEHLTHVASFLGPPSRALFAIAIFISRTEEPESLPPEVSHVIGGILLIHKV